MVFIQIEGPFWLLPVPQHADLLQALGEALLNSRWHDARQSIEALFPCLFFRGLYQFLNLKPSVEWRPVMRVHPKIYSRFDFHGDAMMHAAFIGNFFYHEERIIQIRKGVVEAGSFVNFFKRLAVRGREITNHGALSMIQ